MNVRLRRGARPCAALLALLASGCASTASSPPTAPVVDADVVARSIALCTTTEAELRQRLGEPTRHGLLRDARVVSWIVGEEPVVSYLAVLLDSRGVVVDLYWDLPTEIPWVPTDQCR
jgi:hypothetical protein